MFARANSSFRRIQYIIGSVFFLFLSSTNPMADDCDTYKTDGEIQRAVLFNPETGQWEEVYAMPEMVVTCPPSPDDLDTGFVFRFSWGGFGYIQGTDWYEYEEPSEQWVPGSEEDMYVEVALELVSGSTTIDCTELGQGEARKRDLRILTSPPWPELQITNITKTRRATPAYGHNHTADNSSYKCRGSTSHDNGYADTEGRFFFYFRGPEAAGEVEVKVEYDTHLEGEIPGEKSIVFVNKYSGTLVEITGGTGMALTGHDDYHQAGDTHWASATTKSRIEELAAHYASVHSENLVVNDSSLRYGGLYDFNENWNIPHAGHRDGKHCDIYPTIPDSSKWATIKQKIDQLGSTFFEHTEPPLHIHFIE